jgi:hypothetical protein
MNAETPIATSAPEPLRGVKLLRAAVNKILENPDCWDQTTTHCGTKHCVGGHIQILAGLPANDNTVMEDMRDTLGISVYDAMWLYSSQRTLGEIYNFAKNFDRDGCDRDGRDRDGFDRDGFDRDGRDRDGFDRDGRDRDGNRLEPFVL